MRGRDLLIFRKPTSVLLALGFLVVILVFVAALLFNLYHIGRLRAASESIRVRQQIRQRAVRIIRITDMIYEQVSTSGTVSTDEFNDLDKTYREMVETMRALGLQHVNDTEHVFLNRFAEAAGEMRELLQKFIGEEQSEPTVLSSSELAEFRKSGTAIIHELNRLNDRTGQLFDRDTDWAEKQAEQAWAMGLVVSWAIFATALAVSLLVVFFTHRAIAMPISKLVEGTQLLATGDLSGRLEAPLHGEFRVLAESFNSMAEALQRNQRQLVEAEKLATMGRFAAGIAHEINNPIAVILGYTKTMLARTPETHADKEAFAAIGEEAQHCKDIVQALLDIARPAKEERPETVDVNDVVADALGVARVLQLTLDVSIETQIVQKLVPLTIRRSTLRQILLNIITNALEAMQQTRGGKLRIEGFVRAGPESVDFDKATSDEAHKHFLVLRVADTGPGIAREHMHLLFEPFFTTKKSGTGLGLAITYSIVDTNGGHIVVATAEGEGTTFTISLPLAEEQASQAAPANA